MDGLLLQPGFVIQFQVDPVGFEPTTSSMPLRRAPNCAMGPSCGRGRRSGPGGIRTRDLISAIDARSQLRHRPPQGFEDCNYKPEAMSRKPFSIGNPKLIDRSRLKGRTASETATLSLGTTENRRWIIILHSRTELALIMLPVHGDLSKPHRRPGQTLGSR